MQINKFYSATNNILNAELCSINVVERKLLQQDCRLCQSTGWQQEIGLILCMFSLNEKGGGIVNYLFSLNWQIGGKYLSNIVNHSHTASLHYHQN